MLLGTFSGRSLGSLGELLLSFNHGFNTVVHVLDEVLLGAAETASVRDIEDTFVTLGGLSGGSTDLHVKLLGDGLELISLLSEEWELDMDGGTEGSSEVGWAGGDASEVIVAGESGTLLNVTDGSAESVEDLVDIGTLLHGDDSKLILFVNPDEESLSIVVEDTSARWPVAVEAASLKETVSLTIGYEGVILLASQDLNNSPQLKSNVRARFNLIKSLLTGKGNDHQSSAV